MVTIESVFSKRNQRQALDNLATKKNGAGYDKMPLSDLEEYWTANSERIIESVKNLSYEPGLILEYEIINGKGKRRTVIRQNTIDRFIGRLLAQKLNKFYNSSFQDNNFAYQDGKGIVSAVEKAREYIESGDECVAIIDIKDYFDEINLERLDTLIENSITDRVVVDLIKKYLYCSISNGDNIYKREKGILQGLAISPVLSNLYLNALDEYLDNHSYHWIRYCDDISLYFESEQSAESGFQELINILQKDYSLNVNTSKSGVYDVYEQPLLGYDFHKKGKAVLYNKHIYKKNEYYRNWHECAVEKVNKEYHLINNGTLNKKDYALLFENENEKHHIPVESTEQINIYNEVVLTSAVMRTLSYENVRLGLYDKFGDLLGYYRPSGYEKDAKVLIAQAVLYADDAKRLSLAKKMEMAAMHNLRANLKYYNKSKDTLSEEIKSITDDIVKMNESKNINELLLIEARCRQIYYHAFNKIIDNENFAFTVRSKRPPKDEINALISFGNTLLYNRFQQLIWKTQLDTRIGVFHSANKRLCSLNLDFADIFKPVITDRIIFTIINRGQIRKDYFVKREDGSVYMNEDSKRIFLEEFEKKMKLKTEIKGELVSYNQLLENEVWKYYKFITKGENYKPYKYY